MDSFPQDVAQRHRVVNGRIGDAPEDWDVTIPFRGDRGFAYLYGPGWAGIWLNTQTPKALVGRLRQDFPNLVVQQAGDVEGTFRIPLADLDRMLRRLRAHRRRRLSDDQKAACVERLKPHRFEKHARKGAGEALESTIVA